MDVLNQLNGWDTLRRFAIYALATYGSITVLRKPLEELAKLIKVLRSKEFFWVFKQFHAFRIWLFREPTLQARIAAEKRSPRGALTGAMTSATFYYMYSGLFASLWILHMTQATASTDVPDWRLIGFMVLATLLFCPLARCFGVLAHRERTEAHRLWNKCKVKGTSEYAALVSIPTVLVALAVAVVVLR